MPFKGTKEQEAQLRSRLEEHKGNAGRGYAGAAEGAGESTDICPSRCSALWPMHWVSLWRKIYGISTFYSQFSLCPKGEYKISVCLGTACYVKGSGKIYDELQKKLGITGGECTADGKFSLDACRCIGACGLAPVMTINDDVYGRLTGDELDSILAKY